MGIKVDLDKCTGCSICVSVCPFAIIEMIDDKAQIQEGCTLCGACQEACSYEAILIEVTTETPTPNNGHHGIWVFAEQRDGRLKNVNYELLAKGRELADALKTDLSAVCFGHNVSEIDQLVAYGADKVYLINNPALGTNQEDLYTSELTRLIQEHRPEILLAGATSLGRSFIPRVAAVLRTGLTADCTGLDIDTEKRLLLQTRPTFGGNIMATIICQTRRPQMATVRPRVFKKNTPDNNRQGQIIKVDFKKEAVTSRTKLLSFIEDITEKVKLEDADIIVSGGRGLGKPENFKLIEELGGVLGAAVGSSRPPVDEGWVAYSHQVGQTGKTVGPKLYVACGISGAVQHLAGISTSEIIIAINKDPNAPIFEIATYGIVGDLFQVVPMIIKKLKSE
ncbi:MAG: electron transfer flavoprotein subunit alpha [Dehalococcoidales bacterium]|nr:electron transfer flavoprotein subunit alpha [Dehalococcoidales bacterium]MDP6221379.1 electron transfer flavoprotein subunit alpha [Dehalococcoidales bacterium]MDP7109635.1 electron transfer flavoprotein subunit alpha [Dehalococcoidales bacterium]MDP7310046.1 electron transfer flavoprotein subunit alpha [Dehalococcoidales bacterium]MDP7409568.1 electron transfer flavoprotein subunit alpha [Dehalococcoidales bacterium]